MPFCLDLQMHRLSCLRMGACKILVDNDAVTYAQITFRKVQATNYLIPTL
jgi:hypothetical protein